MADAMMKPLGEANGVKWYWAEPGRFEKPGVYYWDGTRNVLCVPYPAQQAGQGEAVAKVVDTKRGYNTVSYSSETINALPPGTKLYTTPPAPQQPEAPITKDWCMNMARKEVEGDADFSAGAPQQPEALAQQERDREDAERWREWLRGNALTVVVPTPTEKNPTSKTTIVYAPSPFPAFAEAMNAAIDTIRAARSSEGGA